MSISGAIVLYAVIWFLTLFVALPIGVRSQGEAGEVVPGTPASAPSDPRLKMKMTWTTIVATLVWAGVCAVLIWGEITVEDLDIFNRM